MSRRPRSLTGLIFVALLSLVPTASADLTPTTTCTDGRCVDLNGKITIPTCYCDTSRIVSPIVTPILRLP